MSEEITFRWLGTAAWRIGYAGKVIMVDPYVSRNPRAFPVLGMEPADLSDADYIFLSHGHFDHIADVPEIARRSGAQVFCSMVAANTLRRKGVSQESISVLSGQEITKLDGFGVAVTPTKHIRFDASLLLRTAPDVLPHLPSILPEVRGMPAGPVLFYTFDFGGMKVTHMGSMGVRAGDPMVADLRGTDILIPTVQGHTHICRRAAELAADIRPRAVVPQHHDDFFPPVSRYMNLEPFRAMVEKLVPDCSYYEPQINVEFTASDALAGRVQ